MRKGIILFLFILACIIASGPLFAYDSGVLMIYQYGTIWCWGDNEIIKHGPFDPGTALWINTHAWIEIEVNLPYAMQAYLTFCGEFTGSSQPHEDLKATVNGTEVHFWYEDNTWPEGWWQLTVPESFSFRQGRNTIRITHPWWLDNPSGGGSIHFNGSGHGWLRITTSPPKGGYFLVH